LNFPEGTLFNRVNTDRFKYKEITDIILKGFYEVYNELGGGFLESVYENALYIVLTGYGLCVERQKGISATNIEVGLLFNFGRKPESKNLCMTIREKKSAVISVTLWLRIKEGVSNGF